MRPFTLVAAAALLASACSIKSLTLRTTGKLIKEGSSAMESEPDLELARSAVPGQLKTVEAFLVSAPKDRTFLELAASASMQYAFGFLEDDVEVLAQSKKDAPERRAATARAIAMYERAVEHSLVLLETYDAHIRDALAKGGAEWEAAVARLPAGSLPGLTYGGMAMASSVNLGRADPARLVDLPKARTMLERSRAIDPRFYYGGATMVLGIMTAELGDAARARRYFDEAIAVTGGQYLLARVMKARTLLVAQHDRAAFKKTLEEVLEVPRDAFPRTRLANEIARRRAARYLEETPELFARAP